jgi:hypothetical protein
MVLDYKSLTSFIEQIQYIYVKDNKIKLVKK